MEKLIKAVREFRKAFIIAVGDNSPFAKEALVNLDIAIAMAQLDIAIKQIRRNGASNALGEKCRCSGGK